MKKTTKRILAGIVLVVISVATALSALLFYQGSATPTANSYYVALGSSYAAGLGLGPRAMGGPLVCQRSTEGYPQQLARLLKVPSFTDMSCSGATIHNVLYGGQVFLGPQIDALGPDTRLVTLTGGGNDVSYVSDLVMTSYHNRGGLIGAAVSLFWKEPKPVSDRHFDELRADLGATLKEIRKRSPIAKVLVVTYPSALPAQNTCPQLSITTTQIEQIRAVGEQLAEVTRAAVAGSDVVLIDMAAESIGHDACSVEPWVNGFEPLRSAFHPTLAWANVTARRIADKLLQGD